MQQFTVPQFIDVEDKIIGPITTRQFVILLSGAIIIAIFYKLFDFGAFIFLGLLVFGIAVVLAFVKINGRPFHFFLLNLLQTFRRPKLRVWNNRYGRLTDIGRIPTLKFDNSKNIKEYYERSRLVELSLIVDTQGEYQGEKEEDDTAFIIND
ncbi:PrgI family protein [Candidatus Falkowbacteria bacterium]|jgi:hypothetical protein|nr:PrgI family protein [Patescibacteria group bacterium]MDD3434995.1 PrgI family protein [Patescibacteria group bacterium]MDD4466195.1 PrgI family protein [Patescibacteria group bacterium]NCU43154.1 PrgI family protein [Candidatus Falkowbacteria bacterium]